MFDLLTQYQHIIYTTFIIVEVLRYLYSTYSVWKTKQNNYNQKKAVIELCIETYCTVVQSFISKKFKPLNDNARSAFNLAFQLDNEVTHSMWSLINTALERVINKYLIIDNELDNYMKHDTIHDVIKSDYRQDPMYQKIIEQNSNPESVWNNTEQYKFNTDVMHVDNITELNPTKEELVVGTPVTEHPLQNTSIYNGMELVTPKNVNVQSNEESEKCSTSKTPEIPNTPEMTQQKSSKTPKRSRFVIATYPN